MSCNDVCVCAHLEALLNVLGGTFLFHIAESVKYISQLAISSMSKRSPDPPYMTSLCTLRTGRRSRLHIYI